MLAILVCPVTKGPLEYKPVLQELWSVQARLAYTVRDDIPVMIAAEARTLSDAEVAELEGRA